MRNRIRLADKNWGDPLGQLQGKLLWVKESSDRYRLSFALGDCSRYYSYLSATWRRLQEDYELYDRHTLMIQERMQLPEGAQHQPLDTSVFEKHQSSMNFLRLDTDIFFILGKILLDKLAYVLQLLLYNRGESGVPSSFSDQKRYFLKPRNIPYSADEDYARYIREETDWYDRSLKLPRDKLIEHGLTYVSGIKTSGEGTLSLPRMGWGRDLQKIYDRLKKLKSKYETRYTELKKVSDNIFEISTFLLNRPDILLEPDDECVLMDCVKYAGSELPDISNLADNIIRFVEFYSSHFMSKLDRHASHKTS